MSVYADEGIAQLDESEQAANPYATQMVTLLEQRIKHYENTITKLRKLSNVLKSQPALAELVAAYQYELGIGGHLGSVGQARTRGL